MCEYCKDEMNGISFFIGDTGFMAFIMQDGTVYGDLHDYENSFNLCYCKPDDDYVEIVSKREFVEVNNEAWGEDEMKDFIVTRFNYCPFCGRKFGK